MKILVVSNTFDPVTGGGEAERSFQLARHLNISGADCSVLTIDIGLTPERKQLFGPDKMFILPCLFRRFYVPKVTFAQIRKIVKNVDAIHMMGHWSLINILVYMAAQSEKKPYVICPAGSLRVFGRSKLLKLIYNFVIGNRIIKNAATVLAITKDEIPQIESYGVNPERIQVIPNGISEADFSSTNTQAFRKKYGLADRPFMLFLGRLNPIKGPDLLLRAFIEIKNAKPQYDLLFVGPDGGLLNELKLLVAEQQLTERVHFIGYLGGSEKSDALFAADFLVVPSRHEAMSIVALEAGICGTPVLLTDQCGFDELADIGGGWVVAADSEKIAQALTRIISDPQVQNSASLKIKNYVTENFSWVIIVKKYLSLFDRIRL